MQVTLQEIRHRTRELEEIENPVMRDFDAEAEQIIKALRGTTVAARVAAGEKGNE